MVLRDKTEFYKTCFDSMQVGILIWNKNSEIELVNNPLLQIFGYNSNELFGKKISVLFNENSVLQDFILNFDAEIYKIPLEFTGICKSGKLVPIELILGKITYENSFYFKAFITNISSRKEKEQKITELTSKLEEEVRLRNVELEKTVAKLKVSLNKEKELNHLKTNFITLASHEFKTPLSVILSSTELLVKYSDLQNFTKRDEHAIKIKTMINHLNGMLDDLLTLENIESGKIHPKFKEFDFSKWIKEIIKSTKPFLKKNQKLKFKNSIKELVYHDTKILKIIVTNLLNNAIKYSPEESLVEVTTQNTGNYIFIQIADNGIGIPKNEQNLIFKRFFRAKNALYFPGTGIGLNIVQGYVRSLKGNISFESEENRGTIFKVELPKLISHG
jgi:PAS domain S-box-containing protein